MAKVVIVYHSTFGHTKAQAEAILDGAGSVSGVKTSLLPVTELGDDIAQLHMADAIVFGAPTYMGSLSNKFKAFMDNTGSIWGEQKWRNKLAAGFTTSSSASGDKLQTLMQLVIFAAQHGMHWVNLGLMPGNVEDVHNALNMNRLGGWLGAMAQCDKKEGAPLLFESDRATAFHLGVRVSQFAIRLVDSAQVK